MTLPAAPLSVPESATSPACATHRRDPVAADHRPARPGPGARLRTLRPDFTSGSVLGWPAWLRVVAVLPACVFLWLAVAWALAENV
jgi:hypothetical protein